MKKRWLTTLAFLPVITSAADIDTKRAFLEKLRTTSQVQEAGFEHPFLTASTATMSTNSLPVTANHVREYLRKQALPFKGTYGKSGLPVAKVGKDTFPLPPTVVKDDQLAGIQSCKVEKCMMKLNTEKEKGLVEKAPDKVVAYQSLVIERLKRYLQRRELMGYEDRPRNEEFVKKMIATVPFLQSRYPAVDRFFRDGFWKAQPAPGSLVDSFLRQDMFVVAPDRLQPIWRVSEVFEFKEGAGTLFVEIHIYSNHYIDSSLRLYEVIPVDDKAALVISDVLEIDELTGSSIVRMLYLGKMQQAVRLVETEDAEKIL